MKFPNINCVHFDWASGGKCNKLPKFLKLFKRSCPEIYNSIPKECKLHEPYIRNKLLPPEPPPCREYKDYGGNLVRTKKSIQKSYEWRAKL